MTGTVLLTPTAKVREHSLFEGTNAPGWVTRAACNEYRSINDCSRPLPHVLSAGLFDNALASLGEDGSAALSGDARLFSCV